jgi:hypothetical protein
MSERSLIDAIHRRIKVPLHKQSMTKASLTTAGTPDYYYDGAFKDLWVEYKFVSSTPRDRIVGRVDDKKRGCYSTLQHRWMTRRWTTGRNVIGVIGLPDKKRACMQFSPCEWVNGTRIETAVSLSEVADWIVAYCGQLPER